MSYTGSIIVGNNVISFHNGGFFSCCTLKLNGIKIYCNKNNILPYCVNSSNQFNWYKKKGNTNDITFDYFQNYNNINNIIINTPIDFTDGDQYKIYSTLDYNNINPLVKKYFTPSNNIIKIIKDIEFKYKLEYNNICVLFYRGNDKITETILSNYDDYIYYADNILKLNPNIIFLIQSDETEFINLMKNKYFNNSIIFNDEIRHINKCNNTVDKIMKDKNNEFSKYYLAITIIMSKCKYIICGSGNCSLWIMLYRNNSNNICQFLNNKWYDNIKIK